MKLVFSPSSLSGTFDFVPPSKSAAHRALMLGALSGAVVHNVDYSKDIFATLDCLSALGFAPQKTGDTIRFSAERKKQQEAVTLRCKESGSTLRFFIPFSQALGNFTTFEGEGRLPERPLDVYFDLFREKGLSYSHGEAYLPLKVEGRLFGGSFTVRGDISSQFITGLMLSAPLFSRPAKITVLEPFESKPYVDITLKMLQDFGVEATEQGNCYIVPNQLPTRKEYTVEKDWSQAAFFLCGGAINGEITLTGMNPDSPQGDKEILSILRAFGADLSVDGQAVHIRKSQLRGTEVDVHNVPDLVPVLSVLACYAKGKTRLSNAGRLRLKESDRLAAMHSELKKVGAHITMGTDYLEIEGGYPLTGAEICSHNDHRIAMAMAVCSLGTSGDILLIDPHCIDKSYPSFYEDFKKAGGCIHESY